MTKKTKRALTLLLAVILTLTLSLLAGQVTALAAGETGTTGIWNWTILPDDTVSITGCTDPTDNKEIPDKLVCGGLGELIVTNVGNNAFKDKNMLLSITIPGSVKSIGTNAFKGCSNLATITLHEGLESIGDSAFSGCHYVTSVTIPDSVTNIGNTVFAYCSNLTDINVGASNTAYSSHQGILYNKNKTTLICCPQDKTGTYNIPDGVTTIEAYAFTYSNLTGVTIPSSVSTIRDAAFSWCDGFTSVVIPGSVKNINFCAFCYCTKLTSITLGEGVENIGMAVFDHCTALTSITLPASLKIIGNSVFNYSGVTTATILSKTVTIGYDIFAHTNISADGVYGFTGSTAETHTSDFSHPFHPLYIVSFNSTGGTGIGDIIIATGNTINEPATPTRTGCTFGGWYSDSSYSAPVTFPYTVTGDKTIYAKWNCTISFNAGGGSAVADLTVVTGTAIQAPASPTRAGYTFAGWYSDAGCTLPVTFPFAANGNATLYAKWTASDAYAANRMPAKATAGTTISITLPVQPAGYTVQSVTYKSSNTTVATVDTNGTITFLSGGKTTITVSIIARKVDGKGREATKTTTIIKTITVNQPAASISLNKTDVSIDRLAKIQLISALLPTTASNQKVQWRSSDPSIASVNSSGMVSGKKAGTATITCTAKDGSNVQASCMVTVNPIDPVSIKLSKTTLQVKAGKTATLKATVLPKNTDFKTVQWTSSDPSIASVDNKTGKIKGLAPGTVTITATTSNGLSASCTVIINN